MILSSFLGYASPGGAAPSVNFCLLSPLYLSLVTFIKSEFFVDFDSYVLCTSCHFFSKYNLDSVMVEGENF